MSRYRKITNKWIKNNLLKTFKWGSKIGADNISALVLYIVICHFFSKEGNSSVTYDEFENITAFSREKISKGLKILLTKNMISKSEKRSSYIVSDFNNERDFFFMPFTGLYNKEKIIFSNFTLRNKNELNAIKLYLLLCAFRNSEFNITFISYDKITEYTGINRPDIKAAIFLLLNNYLINIERIQKKNGMYFHGYRINYLFPYKHLGTNLSESLDQIQFEYNDIDAEIMGAI